jgi:CRP-like cAMP-binding protein
VSSRLARNISFKSYVSGSYFGDLEIFNQSLRMFSVLAQEPLVLAVIERDDFFHVLKNYPQDLQLILDKVNRRYLKYKYSLLKIQSFKLINMNNEWWEESEDEAEHVNKKISQWIDLVKSREWSSKRNRNFKGSEHW